MSMNYPMLFEKETRFKGFGESPHILPLDVMDYTLIKSASEMHPEIDKYIKSAKPIPGKNILLIDAMGSSDYWGSNVNADYFGSDELKHKGREYGYETFMHYAYPYKHHQNEARMVNPDRRFGEKVVLSVYHEPMHRVQLIVIIDSKKAGDIVDRIDGGQYPDVSMACGVAYDQCSICGSIHKTRDQYCDHAKYQLNQIYPDGRQVYLINHRPRFHDISFVLIGAERASKVLLKVASPYNLDMHFASNPLSMLHEFTNSKLATIPNKIAVIEKEVPVEKTELITDDKIIAIKKLRESEADIHPSILKILAQHPLENIVQTLNSACVDLRPNEFQYLLLNQLGEAEQADQYANQGMCFDPNDYDEVHEIPEGKISPTIVYIIQDVLPERSAHYPYLIERATQKRASITPSVKQFMKWPVMAGLYQGYLNHVPNNVQKMVTEGMNEFKPYLPAVKTASLALAGIKLGRMAAEEKSLDERYLEPIFGTENNNDPLSMDSFNAIFKESGIMDIVKSPALYGVASAPIIYMLSSAAESRANRYPEAASTRDVILGASPLVTTALGSFGAYKGTGALKNLINKGLEGLKGKVGDLTNKYLKKAEIVDNIIWKRLNRSL